MLARTESALSIRGPLLYNEQKVQQDQALLLDAHNFLQEKDALTIRQKMDRFRELAMRNERSEKKIVHLTVNFPVSDRLNDRQMKQIATEFMQRIGFGDQPWLLYRHIDAGHPHLHIVSTNIRPDGSRISSDLRSPHQLKQICFRLEEKYGLTPALTMPDLFGMEQALNQAPDQGRALEQSQTPDQATEQDRALTRQSHYLQKAVYGQRPTKTAIAEVLRTVNDRFAFDSFEAYNAVLSLYNVRAERGREDSPMYHNKGLYYRLIDAEGKKLGAPIKASDFDIPVTLQKVEERCRLNQERVRQSMRNIAVYIDYHLAGHRTPYSLQLFRQELRGDRIEFITPALKERSTRRRHSSDPTLHQPAPPRPDDGHGFFYLDVRNLTVVRDTDLGGKYTAAAILQRTGVERELRQLHEQRQLEIRRPSDRIALQPGHPDTAETRRALLRLSPQHNEIVRQRVAEIEKQLLAQRQQRGHRHSL